MPEDIVSQTVCIVHFDDERNTVSMIPNNLFYTYKEERWHWVVPNSVIRGKFVEQFELRPDSNTHSVVVKYAIVEDEMSARGALNGLKGTPDLVKDAIAIFDLMRARPASNELEPIGLDLYKEACEKVGMAQDRLFILSGFPHLFEAQHPDISFPPGQLLQKPFFARDLVRRIIRLLPEHVRI